MKHGINDIPCSISQNLFLYQAVSLSEKFAENEAMRSVFMTK